MFPSTICLCACASYLVPLIAAAPVDPAETRLHPLNLRGSEDVTEPGNPTTSSNTGDSISSDGSPSLWGSFKDGTLPTEPIRGVEGGSILSSLGNEALELQNADLLAPPSTDQGTVPSSKWPFSMSHNRLSQGGWARQQTQLVLPTATEMAGVNMKLEEGAIRELHWHSANEWAYVLAGKCVVTALDPDGGNFVDTVGPGDLWYFPSGDPHSIQALQGGCEFILVFDTGAFDEDSTFLLSDWLAHIPKHVLDKNFRFAVDSSAFNDVPEDNLYIFNAPLPTADDQKAVSDPYGQSRTSFTYKLSEQAYTMEDEAGWTKIIDSRNFTVSKAIAAAEVYLKSGGIRELHWHPNSDEWSLFLSGTARVGIFAAQSNAHTYNFVAGDVGYIHQQNGHYVECISTDEDCHFLEILNADQFKDISLSQWLAVTPVNLVADHLRVTNETIASFHKTKDTLIPGSASVS